MIAVTFALTQESGDFRRRLGGAKKADVLVAHTGIGVDAAARCAGAVLAAHRPEMLISSGFAGGLDPALQVGDLVVAANFTTPALLDRTRHAAAGQRCFFGTLVTRGSVVETVAAKSALARETGALAVDMETAAISEVCAKAGVPLLAVRAISDAASDALPVPFSVCFDARRQRPRPAALLAWLVAHPGQVLPFARFVRGLTLPRCALADFLFRVLAEFAR